MKSRLMLSMLVIALAAAMVGGATMAWWTDRIESNANEFTAGTLSMNVKDTDGDTFYIDLGDLSNMQPSDETEPYTFLVKNSGSIDMAMFRRFRLGAGSSKALAQSLIVSTYKVNDWSGGFELTEDNLPASWDVDGDGVYTLWDMTQRPDQFGGSWFGIGLEANSEETTGFYEVEFAFTFDPEAGNGLQGKQLELYLDVVATQMKDGAIWAEADRLLKGINAEAVVGHMALWERGFSLR